MKTFLFRINRPRRILAACLRRRNTLAYILYTYMNPINGTSEVLANTLNTDLPLLLLID